MENASASGSRAQYDVVILGGGLAGLTLGLQLKRANPDLRIATAERRSGPAPEAAFKVGESSVEVGANYFAEVVGMKDHLDADQLHKCGLRFFLPAGDNSDISQRVEYGVPFFPPVPSYQIDRGRFENELAERNRAAGVELMDGTKVESVELGGDAHTVMLNRDGESSSVTARWVVDAAGRAFLLKRQLGLEEQNGHNVNSAWLRLANGLDIESWVDEGDSEWFERMTERGLRRMSTNHLCGPGYWVWLIPLSSGSISIGIVADAEMHPYESINTLDGALAWMEEHEPQLAAELNGRRDDVKDFLKVSNFSYGCKQVYSGQERWALVGEAGPFLDPFYSPGSDYIAMGNCYVADLILRDHAGEDVTMRADEYNRAFLAAYETSITHYEGQYVFWGNPQVMVQKISANNIFYWSAIALLFFNRKLTDLEFMAQVQDEVDRMRALNVRLEAFFRQWHELDDREWVRGFAPGLSFPNLGGRHVDLMQPMDDETLKGRLTEDRKLLESVAVAFFHKAAEQLGDEAPARDARIDPYAIGLDPGAWESDGLVSDSGMTLEEAKERTEGLENMWIEAFASPAQGRRAVKT